jgi:hypothetical protein
MQLALYLEPYNLLMTKWKLHDDGTVKSGWVINGAWWYYSSEDEVFCKSDEGYDDWLKQESCDYVTKYPRNKSEETAVLIEDKSGYNSTIEAAKNLEPVSPEALVNYIKLQNNMKEFSKACPKIRKDYF